MTVAQSIGQVIGGFTGVSVLAVTVLVPALVVGAAYGCVLLVGAFV